MLIDRSRLIASSHRRGCPPPTWLQLVSLLRLDTSRLHCTGFSQGGFMAWSLLERYPEFWASVAPAAAGNYGCVRSPQQPVAAQAPRVQTRSVISSRTHPFHFGWIRDCTWYIRASLFLCKSIAFILAFTMQATTPVPLACQNAPFEAAVACLLRGLLREQKAAEGTARAPVTFRKAVG